MKNIVGIIKEGNFNDLFVIHRWIKNDKGGVNGNLGLSNIDSSKFRKLINFSLSQSPALDIDV